MDYIYICVMQMKFFGSISSRKFKAGNIIELEF